MLKQALDRVGAALPRRQHWLGFALVAASAFALGRLSVPSDPHASAAAASNGRQSGSASAHGPGAPSDAPAHSNLSGAAQNAPALDLGTLVDATQLRWSDDPTGLLASIIDDMDRSELALAVATITGRDRAELEKKRDLHAFATSLAEVALAGIVTEAGGQNAAPVEFATRLAQDGATSQADGEAFPASARRMFGLFPLEAGAEERVVAKWYRTDEPELLLFGELPVQERDGQGFVRLDRQAGWPAGEYRLEIYQQGAAGVASDELGLIASGDYRTEGDGPRNVVFR